MVTAFGEYERLAAGSLGCSSLWLGRDHLLYVKGAGFLWPFQEDYRRIRYEDIESVSLMKAPVKWLWWLLSVLGLATLCGSLAWVFAGISREDFSGDVWGNLAFFIWLPPLAVSLGLALAHLVAGQMCVCVVQTAQSSQVLRPVSRWRDGQRVVDRLAERVEEIQRTLPDGESTTAAPEPGPPPKGGTGLQVPWLALPGCVVALLAGAGWIAARSLANGALAQGAFASTLAAFVLLLAGLAAVVRALVPDGVRFSVLGSLILTLLLSLGMPVLCYAVWGRFEEPWSLAGLVEGMSAFALDSDRVRAGAVLAVAGGQAAFALAGIVWCLVWRGRLSRVSPKAAVA